MPSFSDTLFRRRFLSIFLLHLRWWIGDCDNYRIYCFLQVWLIVWTKRRWNVILPPTLLPFQYQIHLINRSLISNSNLTTLSDDDGQITFQERSAMTKHVVCWLVRVRCMMEWILLHFATKEKILFIRCISVTISRQTSDRGFPDVPLATVDAFFFCTQSSFFCWLLWTENLPHHD